MQQAAAHMCAYSVHAGGIADMSSSFWCANACFLSAAASDTNAPGVITIDTTSVSDTCRSVNFFQCVKPYSISVCGSTFTLTSTSGSASDCGEALGEYDISVVC